jgi:hypothetical protein
MKKYEVIGKNENGHFNEFFSEEELNDAVQNAGNLFEESGYMYELDEDGKRVHSINIERTLENEKYDVMPSDIVYNW